MFLLKVTYAGDSAPREVTEVTGADAVLSTIPQLLSRHRGCERIDVFAGTTRLFSVDCRGNRIDP